MQGQCITSTGLFGEAEPATKVCGDCKVRLPATNFSLFKHRNGRRYLKSMCRPCELARNRAWRHTAAGQRKMKDTNLRKKYGIGRDDYDRMLALQNGACAICGGTELPIDPRTNRPYELAVDHCHATGKVRSLLCHFCNVGLGAFRDDPALMHAAISYLERHRD